MPRCAGPAALSACSIAAHDGIQQDLSHSRVWPAELAVCLTAGASPGTPPNGWQALPPCLACRRPPPCPALSALPALLLPLLRFPLCCWLSAHGQLLCSRWQPTLRGHAWQVADSTTAPPIPTQHCSAFSYCRAHSSWRCTAAGSGQHQLGLCCSPLLPASSLSKFNVCAPAQLSSASVPGCTGYRV